MALSMDAANAPQVVSDSSCSRITDNISTPSFEIGESCLVDGKYYSQGDYNQLRKNNIGMFEEKYMNILNNTTLNEYQRHHQLACIMNKLMDNIVTVTGQNDTRFKKNQAIQNLIGQNEITLDKNEDSLMKDKDIKLVKDHRVANSESRSRRIDMYYIIMVALIVGIVIVILILQNFVL